MRTWISNAAVSNAAMIARVTPWPYPASTARKSAPVSPAVVDMILMIKNESVTSGNLLSKSFELVTDNLSRVGSLSKKQTCIPFAQADLTKPRVHWRIHPIKMSRLKSKRWMPLAS